MLYLYDWESTINIALVSFLDYKSGKVTSFIWDDDVGRRDSKEFVSFIKGKYLVGYNNAAYDNLLTNYVCLHPECTAADLHRLTFRIIAGQKLKDFNLYKEFSQYIHNDSYQSIDLMRLLFSKKLRVGLKELECSLQFENVSEFEWNFDVPLTNPKKRELLAYNINDVRATKLVLEKSMPDLQLRRWMEKEYKVDAFNLDSVNGGVKILEVLYAKEVGNYLFKKQRTMREWVDIKDIILPLVKFESEPFQKVLGVYKAHRWYSKHYDEELWEDSGLVYEPTISGFKFKFSLGGLHGYSQPGVWKSDGDYEIWSIDINNSCVLTFLIAGKLSKILN